MKQILIILSIFLAVIITACNNDKNNNSIASKPDLFVPDDLEATLWAATPLFYNPTNMDVDSRGRIWITEATNYRNYNNDSAHFLHHSKGDRVMILEDTNHDGRADKSTVFIQDKDLISPVGIAVIGKQVIVSCSPNLIVYTDENGDDIPDKKEILLTGFGGKDHDHSLHAVYAGPDGNWYFNVGNAGPHIVKDKSGWTLRAGSIYSGGSPYNQNNQGNMKSDDGKVWVGGLALKMKPGGTGLHVMGHNFRNSYEVIPDSYGNLWQNDNDDQVVTCRTTWLMEGGNAGYFSTNGLRFWQGDQRPGQDIFIAHWHQEDPGVMPAGDRSGSGAPTGIVMNEADALGKSYRGLLLSADAGRNTIFGYHPTLKQSGFDMGKRNNFISSLQNDNQAYVWNDSAQNASKDKWFRPSDVTIGTDGAIYIADWYDPVVGGHQMKDSTGYGRIYRIAPKNKKLITPKIDLSTTEGQLSALQNPAINVRNNGFVLLKQQGEKVLPEVKELLKNENPFIQARAIWLMPQLGNKGINETIGLLKDSNEQTRSVAYKALRETLPDITTYAMMLAKDPSAFVRREVIISLSDMNYSKKKKLLLDLAKGYDGEDRWYLETLGYAVQGNESDFYLSVKKILAEDISASKWNKQMAAFAWRLHPPEALGDLMIRAKDSLLSNKERQTAITAIGFINTRSAAMDMLSLAKNNEINIRESAAYWLSFRRNNDWYNLLDWKKLKINTAYERKLAEMKVKRQIVLDEDQSPDERENAVKQMAADSLGGQLLIGMAAENKISVAVLPYIEDNIFNNPNSVVRVQASNYFKRKGANKIFAISKITNLPSDPIKGKEVFVSRCSSCHQSGTIGKSIGPSLTGIGKKFGQAELLDAIINPGASIVFGYESWLVNKKDGESIFGFLVSESKQNIVIRDIAGDQHVIPTDKISGKKKQSQSLMPDPISNGLTEQNLADVAAYLLKENRK